MLMRPVLIAAAVLSVGACGGGGSDSTSPPVVTPAFTMTLASGTMTVQQGLSATVGVALVRTNFTGAVALGASGTPSGASVSFAPQSATADASVMTFNAGTAAAGTYTLAVSGSGAGLTDRTATLAVTVTAAPASSYAMTLSASAASIQQGATTPVTVTLTRTNFTGDVTLTLAGLPTGATGSFGTNPVSGSSSVLTLGGGTATPGTYNLTVTGTAAGQANRTAPFALTITQAPVATTLVTMQNIAFNPPDIRVAPGASVSWSNNDGGTNHNATFSFGTIGTTGDFGSGSRTLTMPTAPGTYSYRCTLHPGMNGSVQVQ